MLAVLKYGCASRTKLGTLATEIAQTRVNFRLARQLKD
jgi:hypothetical protein